MSIGHFIKEEKQGVKDYEKAEKRAGHEEREAYKEIVPDEKKHIKKLKEARKEEKDESKEKKKKDVARKMK